MSQVIDAAAKFSEAEDAVTAPLADSHIVTFADGVTIGTVLYTEAELRQLTARDLIAAQEASEKVVRSRDAVTLVSSPARMGIELLRRQVKRLRGGDSTHNGPLSVEELGRLSIADFERLRLAADGLDLLSSLHEGESLESRGRDAGGDA